MALNRLRLAVAGPAQSAAVTLDEQPVAARLTEMGGAAILEFAAPLTLTAGQTLAIAISL